MPVSRFRDRGIQAAAHGSARRSPRRSDEGAAREHLKKGARDKKVLILSTAEGVLMVDLELPERPKDERALRGLCEESNTERPLLAWGARRLVLRALDRDSLSTAT